MTARKGNPDFQLRGPCMAGQSLRPSSPYREGAVDASRMAIFSGVFGSAGPRERLEAHLGRLPGARRVGGGVTE
jgi:hypothetical protein